MRAAVEQARLCGLDALAIVDRNSLAGIVRAHEAAKASGVRLIVGCRLDLIDGTGVLVYPTDRPAYSRLTRLLSLGKRRAGKAKCHLDWSDLKDWSEGLIAILVPDEADEACAANLRRLKATFPAGSYLALTARADGAFRSVDDLWPRAGARVANLVRLAEADAFRPDLYLDRRDALWAIKGLRDDPLPLFAAAKAHDQKRSGPETDDAGREVVDDYSHIGLTLRDHPLSFLRGDLQARHVMTCADGTALRDGRLTRVAGLVLVRQKPGNGVMFITIEDETGVANLVIWPSLDEREGDVVHIVATKLHDASGLLASVGDRGEAFPCPMDGATNSIVGLRRMRVMRPLARSWSGTSPSPIFTSMRSDQKRGIFASEGPTLHRPRQTDDAPYGTGSAA